MKKLALLLCAVVALSLPAQTSAPDLAGTWQGTLQAGKSLRIVMKIARPAPGAPLKTTLYSIDQGGQGFTSTETTLQGSAVHIAAAPMGLSYDGKLSADGNSIAGSWSQGPNGLPLTLTRATTETAWAIPEAPAPPKMMAADADPAFEVTTIKPNNTGATSIQQLTVQGRNFKTRASSLSDLIGFAYQMQAKQIMGGPQWIDTERYDVDGVPDKEGTPNADQLRVMVQKLLAERFQLTFHHDKREMAAFVLTPGKTGPKLTPTQMKGPLPGMGMSPGKGGLSMSMMNATTNDFTSFLQALVLDRSVVDQTGIAGRYDFQMTFTADETQFNGHAPKLPPDSSVEAAPSLFDAVQQQLGLKLESKKAPVDTLVIDKVQKPSAN